MVTRATLDLVRDVNAEKLKRYIALGRTRSHFIRKSVFDKSTESYCITTQ